MSERVYGIVSVYDHEDLVPHFLDHYAKLGVTRLFLSVRDAAVYERVKGMVGDYPAEAIYTPAAFFSDSDKAKVEKRIIELGVPEADDYVMHLDLDEFQEYPAPLSAVVREMNRHNDWALRGWVVDRVASDGKLQAVAPSPSIFEQFPVEADVTSGLLGGWTQKIVLCRKRVRLKGGVRHDTENARYDRVPIGAGWQYRVHHFKWLAGLDARLTKRLEEPGTSTAYKRECKRFLDHYKKFGCIYLAMPALRARHRGAFAYQREA